MNAEEVAERSTALRLLTVSAIVAKCLYSLAFKIGRLADADHCRGRPAGNHSAAG